MVAAMGANPKLLLELDGEEDLLAIRALKEGFHRQEFLGGRAVEPVGFVRIPPSEGNRGRGAKVKEMKPRALALGLALSSISCAKYVPFLGLVPGRKSKGNADHINRG
jgi:hypothetical protein